MNYVNRALCAALIAIPAFVHSQPAPYWLATDPRPLSRWAGASAAAFDASGNGFVVGAFSDMDEQSGEVIGSNVGVHLTKFSPTGQVLWRTETFFSATDYYPYHYEIWPTSDGGALVHYDYDLVKYVTASLTKYDAQGHVQWTNGFDTVGGASDGSSFGFIAGLDDYPSYFLKLNAAGVQQWKATIEQPFVFLRTILPDGKGGAWAAGTSHPSYQDYHRDLTVFHFNSSGQFQSWTYDGINIEPSSIRLDSVGNVVIGGTGPADSQTTRALAIAKVDSAGVLQWSKIFDQPIHWSAPWDFLQNELDSSGNIFASYLAENSAGPALMKLTPNGSTLWSKTYAPANSNALFLSQFLVDPGGNAFALYGRSDKTTGNYDYNLVKYLPGGGLGWSLPNGALVYDRGPVDSPAGLGRDQAGFLYMAGISQGDGDRLGHNVVKLGPANNAAFIGQTVPSSMVAGQTYPVSLTFNNSGVNPWSFADDHYLRFSSPTDSDLWSAKGGNLGSTEVISAGGSKTFKFNVVAPMSGGSYGFQYRMAQGSSSFGSPSPLLNIPVVVKQHAARYLSQSVPSSVKAGSTFTVKVTMENVGTNTWTKAAGYMLASLNPDLNTLWGVSSVPLGSTDSVARGQNKSFTFSCVAPATPGTYTMRWMMRRQASAFTGMFGDKTTTKTITVTP